MHGLIAPFMFRQVLIGIERKFFNSRLLTKLFGPLIAVSPSLLLATTQIQNLPVLDVQLHGLRDYFNAHPYVTDLCLAWTIILLVVNYAMQPHIENLRRYSEPNAAELGQLLRHLDETVGTKMERLGEIAVELQKTGANCRIVDVFYRVIQPEEQIRLLLDKLYVLLLTDINDPRVELKIVLAKMGPRYVESFAGFRPADFGPMTQLNYLQVDHCAFSVAAKARRSIIIPNIDVEWRKKKGARYAVAPDASPLPDGSMICYPIAHRHLNRVPFVLSIKCSKRNHFSELSRSRYEYLLKPFENGSTWSIVRA